MTSISKHLFLHIMLCFCISIPRNFYSQVFESHLLLYDVGFYRWFTSDKYSGCCHAFCFCGGYGHTKEFLSAVELVQLSRSLLSTPRYPRIVTLLSLHFVVFSVFEIVLLSHRRSDQKNRVPQKIALLYVILHWGWIC